MNEPAGNTIIEEVRSVLRETLDAVVSCDIPVTDRDLPGFATVGPSGRAVRFSKAQGCMRITVEGRNVGLEVPNDLARDVSGEKRGSVHWNCLATLPASLGSSTIEFVPSGDDDNRRFHSRIGVEDEERMNTVLAAGQAWSLTSEPEEMPASVYTFSLGRSSDDLRLNASWEFEVKKEIISDPSVFGVLSPKCQRLAVEIASQAPNEVTKRKQKGAPVKGYARLTRDTSRLSVDDEDPVASMRLINRIETALAPHGKRIEDVAKVHAKHVRTVDMSKAVVPATFDWKWPSMIPTNVEHELNNRGVDPIWANRLANGLMRSQKRAGHMLPMFIPREVGGAVKWYDAPPGSPRVHGLFLTVHRGHAAASGIPVQAG